MPISHSLSKRLRSDSHHDRVPSRTFSSRSGKQMNMGDISMPVNLLTTTNILSYEAPDISVAQRTRNATPQPTHHQPTESTSATSATSAEAPALTDGSSAGSSPVEYNHLSCYFPGPSPARTKSARQAVKADETVPALPQRALSHSKREHERLARQRSQRSTASPTSSTPSSPTADRNSFDMIGKPGARETPGSAMAHPASSVFSPPPRHHPFGNELEQLNEVAETFNDVTRHLEDDEDAAYMRQRGLAKFSVSEYLSEISPLFPTAMFTTGISTNGNGAGWI